MEILNIGPLELIIILLLMFVLLGPKEMIRTANRVGRWIRNFVRSPMWKEIMGYSQEIRELPQKIMEESGLQETVAEIKQTTQEAADELNTSIKEVNAAARVPEAEHLTLDTTGLPETNSIKPDTLPSQPEPVPYGSAEAEVADYPESMVAPEYASASETASEAPISEESTASQEAVVSTDVQPAAVNQPAVENLPAAMLSVSNPQPAVEEAPVPRKRRTKSAPPEGEAPAPARTRRKKADIAVTQPSDEIVQPAAEVVQPSAEVPSEPVKPADAEPAPAPRRGRPRKIVAPVETAAPETGAASSAASTSVTMPAPNGSNEFQPANGKSAAAKDTESPRAGNAEVYPADSAVIPNRKPRARRTTKPVEPTGSNGAGSSSAAGDSGAEHNPEQVTPSDAA